MKFSTALFLAAASTAAAFAPTNSLSRSATSLNIAAGDDMPSVELLKGFPDPDSYNMAEYSKGKNMIVVGLPGAFTPT